MKNHIYRFFRNIHLWLSVPFGLIIMLIAFSGAMLIFEPEVTDFLLKHNFAELSGKPLRLPFFSAMNSLHRSLALGSFGKLLVGWSMWGLIFILISGIVMWVRSSRKNFLRSLSLMFPNALRGWHVNLGAYMMLILLVIAVTGLQWNEEWFRNVFYSIFDSGDATIYHTVFLIHSGSWGGITTRIIWFVVCLGCVSFPFTGLFLWLRRKRMERMHKEADENKSVRS